MTLAETLVVIFVIGTIASMTLPTLNNKIQDMQLKSAWKNDYSVLANANSSVAADYGGDLTNAFSNSSNYFSALRQKLNVQKYCATSATGKCWSSSFKSSSNSATYITQRVGFSQGVILNDGTFVIMGNPWTSNCQNTSENSATTVANCALMFVDVNGFKGPNTQGKDIYGVYIIKNKISPLGSQDDYFYKYDSTHCCSSNEIWEAGLGCSAQYLYQ